MYGLSDAAVSATLQTAWLVNGPAALDVLAHYAPSVHPGMWDQLGAASAYFDADEFADRVLAKAPAGGVLTLRHAPHRVRALDRVPPLSDLYVHQNHIGSLPRLRHLDLVGAAPGLDLAPLAANRRLTVTVRAGQDVRGADELGRRVTVV